MAGTGKAKAAGTGQGGGGCRQWECSSAAAEQKCAVAAAAEQQRRDSGREIERWRMEMKRRCLATRVKITYVR